MRRFYTLRYYNSSSKSNNTATAAAVAATAADVSTPASHGTNRQKNRFLHAREHENPKPVLLLPPPTTTKTTSTTPTTILCPYALLLSSFELFSLFSISFSSFRLFSRCQPFSLFLLLSPATKKKKKMQPIAPTSINPLPAIDTTVSHQPSHPVIYIVLQQHGGDPRRLQKQKKLLYIRKSMQNPTKTISMGRSTRQVSSPHPPFLPPAPPVRLRTPCRGKKPSAFDQTAEGFHVPWAIKRAATIK